jgi:hypothetical protein
MNGQKKSPRLSNGPPMRNLMPRGHMPPHGRSMGAPPPRGIARQQSGRSIIPPPPRDRPRMGGMSGMGGWNRPPVYGSRMIAPPRGQPFNNTRRRPMENEQLSIRPPQSIRPPRYGFGGVGGVGGHPMSSPSPRDQPGLTPRHSSPRHVSPRHMSTRISLHSTSGMTMQNDPSRFPPRPNVAPPSKPPNTKKKQLLMEIESIDLQIAQKEQQLETAQENANLLSKSMLTGKKISELTSSSVSAESSNSNNKTNDTTTNTGGFVNLLIPTKLSISEIVAKTLKENRKRAFASRAILTKYIDDETMKGSKNGTIRGVPTLKRIHESRTDKGCIEWRAQDEGCLPLYACPQQSPSWDEVLAVHEKNKTMITEAVSIRKSTTNTFAKAVASKYHQYYLAWQERLRKITQTGGGNRDRRRRERAQRKYI